MGRELRRYKIKKIRENCEEIKKNEGEDKDEKNGKCEIEKNEKTVRIERCGWPPHPTNPSHPSRYRYSFVKVLSGSTSGTISLYHHQSLVAH